MILEIGLVLPRRHHLCDVALEMFLKPRSSRHRGKQLSNNYFFSFYYFKLIPNDNKSKHLLTRKLKGSRLRDYVLKKLCETRNLPALLTGCIHTISFFRVALDELFPNLFLCVYWIYIYIYTGGLG